MNRADFMKQLESLLQNISQAEREEALQYYNDYFDDAGVDNEQAVLDALGTPAKVAENIKRDLLSAGAEMVKVTAGDRVMIPYEENVEQNDSKSSLNEQGTNEAAAYEMTPNGVAASGQSVYEKASNVAANGQSVYEKASNVATNGQSTQERTANAQTGSDYVSSSTGKSDNKKNKLSPGIIVLIVVLSILASPILLPVAGALLGVFVSIIAVIVVILVTWFALIIAFGAVTISLLVTAVALAVVSVISFFGHPLIGVSILGVGLLCGGIGLLFMMLTVGMAGVVTPAFCRWSGILMGKLFAGKKKGKKTRETA